MLRFRASYQRAVRAPNVGELYSSQSVALDGTEDPCAGDTPQATLAQCQATGMTAAQYGNVPENPAGQYNGLLGGNPDLDPETSDTKSIGLVIRPPVGDLSIAIDYFDIKVEDTISSTAGGNADTFINNCINGFAEFCPLVHRDEFGSLWLSATNAYIVDTSLNLGTLRTNGIDLQSSYTLNAGEHRFGFNLVGTYRRNTATPRCLASRRTTAWATTVALAVFRRRAGVIRSAPTGVRPGPASTSRPPGATTARRIRSA
jgi:outer membrane receptor protein involved in Fe transport